MKTQVPIAHSMNTESPRSLSGHLDPAIRVFWGNVRGDLSGDARVAMEHVLTQTSQLFHLAFAGVSRGDVIAKFRAFYTASSGILALEGSP